MHSAIYSGWLRHRRFAPREHAFRYRLFLVYLDLAEIDRVFAGRWLWGTHRLAPARFDRADHFGDPSIPLDQSVRNLVHERTGARPDGPIRLLTHLRYFGYCFNPVSFYYCFDAADTRVDAIVAEVTSTPWGERHCYVLSDPMAPRTPGYARYQSGKAMHVSPFMPMDLDYRWGFTPPGTGLSVHMSLHRPAGPHAGSQLADPRESGPPGAVKMFDATMHLARQPIDGLRLATALLAFPLMTLKVIAAIHWQAALLWLKRIPTYAHPAAGSVLAATSTQQASAPKRS